MNAFHSVYWAVNISFIGLLFVFVLILIYHLIIEKIYSPFVTVYFVFNFLFFYIAPLVQLDGLEALSLFPNTYPFKPKEVIVLNTYISVFNLVFLLTYIVLKKKYFEPKTIEYKNLTFNKFVPLLIFLILIISGFLLLFYRNLISELILFHGKANTGLTMIQNLIVRKIFFSIPSGALFLGILYIKNKRENLSRNMLYIFVFTLILLLFFVIVKNPFIEKRNALGPLYITLLFCAFPKLLNTNRKMMIFFFLVMIFIFPIMSIFTHSQQGIMGIKENPTEIFERVSKESIQKEFKSLHYDAYSNTLSTIDNVSKNGITYGHQLLGSIFFFIPRSIWVSKPIGSGKLGGRYLMKNYSMWFDNLSNPFISEGILNFGILGVILFPIILVFFIVKVFLNWLYSSDPLKCIVSFYFAVHLLFLLRGDLTNGISYYIGPLIGMLFVPKVLLIIIKNILKK
ncbi:O-antigen polysaccharide polymerase Wzy [Flavivirga sp. Y03]|uniref:O-antigen polysaccharide polymerase Wzy n=2 Tax=Flavivirga algicola TaxID=2729136 RepID=A0ABX1S0H3_9FLAO|nr:O-antigen polysaccharide polymerase Wzy [Flavivirga algicola]